MLLDGDSEDPFWLARQTENTEGKVGMQHPESYRSTHTPMGETTRKQERTTSSPTNSREIAVKTPCSLRQLFFNLHIARHFSTSRKVTIPDGSVTAKNRAGRCLARSVLQQLSFLFFISLQSGSITCKVSSQ